jgi:hypothetical protein
MTKQITTPKAPKAPRANKSTVNPAKEAAAPVIEDAIVVEEIVPEETVVEEIEAPATLPEPPAEVNLCEIIDKVSADLINCALCKRLVNRKDTFTTGNGNLCKDSAPCNAARKALPKADKPNLATQAAGISAQVRQAKGNRGTTKKAKIDKAPTSRDVVRGYIADKQVFTVADIATLLDTNSKNAAVTIHLLITRPGSMAPIPFHLAGKGTYVSTVNPPTVDKTVHTDGESDLCGPVTYTIGNVDAPEGYMPTISDEYMPKSVAAAAAA